MFAKFPFYSVAQIYAISLDTPVSILLGQDNLYWVVDKNIAADFMNKGCSVMHTAN